MTRMTRPAGSPATSDGRQVLSGPSPRRNGIARPLIALDHPARTARSLWDWHDLGVEVISALWTTPRSAGATARAATTPLTSARSRACRKGDAGPGTDDHLAPPRTAMVVSARSCVTLPTG